MKAQADGDKIWNAIIMAEFHIVNEEGETQGIAIGSKNWMQSHH
jgi:hypothetical protein